MHRSGFSDLVLAIEQAAYTRGGGSPALVRTGFSLEDPLLAPCLRADLGRLRALGVSGIVLLSSMDWGSEVAPWALRWLGPPAVTSGSVSGWSLADVVSPPLPECARFSLDNVAPGPR